LKADLSVKKKNKGPQGGPGERGKKRVIPLNGERKSLFSKKKWKKED